MSIYGNAVLPLNALSNVVTMQNAATAVGTGTVLPTAGYGVASLAISGTFVGTIEFDAQAADGNWYPINARQRGGNTIGQTTTTTGLYEIDCLGLSAVRANITAYTSGSITVKGQAQALTPTSDTVQLTGSNTLIGATVTMNTVNVAANFPGNPCHEVTVIAKAGNVGTIYCGGSNVTSSNYGVALKAKDSFTFNVSNTNMVYILADTSGDGVSYVAV